jgi:hypothetical protein
MKELKDFLFKCLNEKLEPVGFKFSKAKQGFVKETDLGQLWFSFLFYKYAGVKGFEINPVMQIRFEQIEEIFHKESEFSNKDQKGTSTVGCSIENFLAPSDNNSFRKTISSENDITITCNFFYYLFQSIVVPFFNKYNSLESLNELINSHPKENLNLIHPIFRGSKGLIIAHLLKDEDFEQLKKVYGAHYDSYYDGFYKPDFEKIVKRLK